LPFQSVGQVPVGKRKIGLPGLSWPRYRSR